MDTSTSTLISLSATPLTPATTSTTELSTPPQVRNPASFMALINWMLDVRWDAHGTAAAGVALATNNSMCGVGAAYGAQGAGIRLISDAFSDSDTAQALTYR